MEKTAETQVALLNEGTSTQPVSDVVGISAADESSGSVFKFKILKSVCLTITWVCMGLYSGVTGPTIPDFSERLHVDYHSLGFTLAFRSVGKMVGAVTCGYLRDRLSGKGDLIIGIALAAVALAVGSKPWVPSIGYLNALFAIEGIAHGGINAVGNAMCVLMWKDKAGLPVHLMHFGYGAGAMISPLIARPFLSEHRQINVTSTGLNTTSLPVNEIVNTTSGLQDITVKVSQIEIPYAIIAVFVLLFSFVYFGFFLYKPYQRLTKCLGRQSYKNPFNAPFLQDRPCSAVSIISLMFFYYILITCIGGAIGSFLFTYAVESDIGFSKGEAAYLNTAYFACYAGGRVIMGLMALKVSVKYLVFLEIYGLSACVSVMTFVKSDRKLIIWIFASIQGFFFGPLFPTGMAWVDRYVPLYGLIVALFDVANGIGGFFFNWLSGYLISNVGPYALLYLAFTASCCLCVLAVFAKIIGAMRGDRH